MVSSCWAIRGMPSVVTLSTWVSPRWKSAEPCAVGKRSTSALSGRMSVTPRPSMRRPSSTIRLRTSCLVRLRIGGLDLALALGELVGQLGDDRRRRLGQRGVALGLGDDRVGRGEQAGAGRSTRSHTSSS